MTYKEWLGSVPATLTDDPLWRVEAYRLSLFAADLGWPDATKLVKDKRTIGLANQLFRAVGAISSDIAEGYSRKSGKDQARFYEYALGSTRESRNWYYEARHVLGDKVSDHQMKLLTEVARLLLTMIPNERGYSLREEPPIYEPSLPILSENAPTP